MVQEIQITPRKKAVYACNLPLDRCPRGHGKRSPSNCMTSYPHTAQDTLAKNGSSEHPRERSQEGSTNLDKALDPLFDIHRIRLESGDELSCDFVDEVVMGQVLPVFHDPDNACLQIICKVLLRRSLGEYSTSVWCLRSSSILSCVSFRSSVLSTLEEIVLILIF